jgi:hypothetical protein
VQELLSGGEGNEPYVRDVSLYVYKDELASFFDVMARARKRCEVAVGCALHRWVQRANFRLSEPRVRTEPRVRVNSVRTPHRGGFLSRYWRRSVHVYHYGFEERIMSAAGLSRRLQLGRPG